MVDYLSQEVQKALRLPAAPNADTGFFDLGMDSLKAVELCNQINEALSLAEPLLVTDLFDHANVHALSQKVLERLGASPEYPMQKREPRADAPGRRATRIPGGARRKFDFTTNSGTTILRGTDPVPSVVGLSVLDLPPQMGVAFFFKNPPDIKRLAESLTETLNYVPILAGRLRGQRVWSGYIECKNHGIPFTLEDSTQLLPPPERQWDEQLLRYSSAFVPSLDKPRNQLNADSPLFAVKATRTADGGLVLGLRFSHLIMDLKCLELLMATWASLYRGVVPGYTLDSNRQAINLLLPAACADKVRMLIRRKSVEQARLLLPWLRRRAVIWQSRFVSVTFGGGEVAAIHRSILDQLRGPVVSPMQALSALALKRLAVLRLRDSRRSNPGLGLVVDLRGRLQGITPFFFGNAYTVLSDPKLTTQKVAQMSLAEVALALRTLTNERSLAAESEAFIRLANIRRLAGLRTASAVAGGIIVNSYSGFVPFQFDEHAPYAAVPCWRFLAWVPILLPWGESISLGVSLPNRLAKIAESSDFWREDFRGTAA